MKRLIQITLLLFLFSCNDPDNEPEVITPENGMDAASKFLRAALDGDYTKAKTLLVKD